MKIRLRLKKEERQGFFGALLFLVVISFVVAAFVTNSFMPVIVILLAWLSVVAITILVFLFKAMFEITWR